MIVYQIMNTKMKLTAFGCFVMGHRVLKIVKYNIVPALLTLFNQSHLQISFNVVTYLVILLQFNSI